MVNFKREDKKILLFHFLTSYCIKHLFTRGLTATEKKHLFNIVVGDKASEVSKRLHVAQKTLKFHRTNIAKALRPELKSDKRNLSQKIHYHCLFDGVVDLMPDEIWKDIAQALKHKPLFVDESGLPSLAGKRNFL